jgi:site-specific DNA-methyltransferase (adenine-specific)
MNWRVIQGDCLTEMAKMDAGSFDLVCFSPPYNSRIEYSDYDDQVPWSDYYTKMHDVIHESYRILVTGGTIAINVPMVIRWQREHKHAASWYGFDPNYKSHFGGVKSLGKGRIEPLGFRLFDMMCAEDPHVREPITWVKGSGNVAMSTTFQMGCDSDPYMRPTNETILLGSKGQWFHRGGTGRRGRDAVPFVEYTKDTWIVQPESNPQHPAIFPVEIPRRLMRLFCHAKDSNVCDPFMGYGQTAMAAVELGHNFVGVDISPRYCAIARARIDAATRQGKLGL